MECPSQFQTRSYDTTIQVTEFQLDNLTVTEQNSNKNTERRTQRQRENKQTEWRGAYQTTQQRRVGEEESWTEGDGQAHRKMRATWV